MYDEGLFETTVATDQNDTTGTVYLAALDATGDGSAIDTTSTTATAQTENRRHHIAFVFSAAAVTICLDGAAVATIARTAGPFSIGRAILFLNSSAQPATPPQTTAMFTMLRISTTARYTAPFTPPIPSEVAADADTLAMYSCQDQNPNQLTDDTGNYTLPFGQPGAPLVYQPFP